MNVVSVWSVGHGGHQSIIWRIVWTASAMLRGTTAKPTRSDGDSTLDIVPT